MAEKTQDKSLENKSNNDKYLAKPGVVVELIKGDQWCDDLSGIKLFRGFYDLVSEKDMKGKNRKLHESGFKKLDKEQSPTAILPKGKNLTRVEKALRLGILKIHDPEKPVIYKELLDRNITRMEYNKKAPSGLRYKDEADERINLLLKLPIDKFKTELQKLVSFEMVEKVFEAECAGRNSTAGVRKNYMELIREHLNSDKIKGVGVVKSVVEEKVYIK